MSSTCFENLLDSLETFFGHLGCGAQSAGIDALRAADLTFSQVRSLLVLADRADPIPISEIAANLRLSVAAAGRNIDQLVRAGLVDRHEDDVDRRVKRICLTASGRELISGFKAHQRRYALDLLRSIGETDCRRLLAALEPVVAELGRLMSESSKSSPAHQTDQSQEISA